MRVEHKDRSARPSFTTWLLAAVSWSLALIVLSLIPVQGHALRLFAGQDKLVHFLSYLLLAWLVSRFLSYFSISSIKTFIYSMVYAVLFGALLELLQSSFTQSRSGELLDLIANATGALCGCVIFCLMHRSSLKHDNANS